MSDDETEILPEARFFSDRAKFVPHVSTEEIKSFSDLYKDEISPETETNIQNISPPLKIRKRRHSGKEISEEPVVKNVEESFDPPSPVVLSAAVKRRLRKRQQQRAEELRLIEIENQKVLSAVDCSALNDDEEIVDIIESDVNITFGVSYLSQISSIRCSENEKFSTLFPRIADLFNLKASELLFCLRERNISVDDTPKSLNITYTDTIECIPYKIDGSTQNDDDLNVLKIIFQSSDCKEKVGLLIHKLEKMGNVMERYSEIRNIPLDYLVFEFDGDKIEGNETSEDLDMESGNCIDVTVKNFKKKKDAPKKFDNDSEEDIMKIVTDVHSDSSDSILID